MTIDNLSFDKENENFEILFSFGEEQYMLTIYDLEADQETQAQKSAQDILTWLEEHIDTVKDFASTSLLETKNDAWLEDGETALTVEKFKQSISLDNVVAFSNGSFEVFFDDNDLFWGHAIMVDISSTFNLENAGIAG